MGATTMTPRERWRAAAERRGTDRPPVDYWGTPEMTEKLKAHLGVADEHTLWRVLGVDKSFHVGPDLCDPYAAQRREADVWGVRRRVIEYAGGAGSYEEFVDPPLAAVESVAELERYPWPDPDWWIHDRVAERCAEAGDYPVIGGTFEPFYLYSAMRGLERAMEDLIERPALVEAALERIFEIHVLVIGRTLEAAAGRVDLVYVAEDLGGQRSLLFSPAVIQRFFLPRMRRMIELAHAHGALAFHHDDGAIRPIIPALLDAGIDVLNPVQWRCPGMDREELKREFGNRVCFHGAMDNQRTLPFGGPEDVRAEVRDNLRLLGRGGGYILAPCHNLQVITPVENVLAMYDEARKV
jgi:uroporphyrinogen decarboxylase